MGMDMNDTMIAVPANVIDSVQAMLDVSQRFSAFSQSHIVYEKFMGIVAQSADKNDDIAHVQPEQYDTLIDEVVRASKRFTLLANHFGSTVQSAPLLETSHTFATLSDMILAQSVRMQKSANAHKPSVFRA